MKLGLTKQSPSAIDALRHRPRLVLASHLHLTLHGSHAWGRFNSLIAVRATDLLSSMNFFWFCVLLDIGEITLTLAGKLPLIALLITILSQTVIQLLALPLLGASQKIISMAQDARAEADHETLSALHVINQQQLALLEGQSKEIALLRKFVTASKEEEKSSGK